MTAVSYPDLEVEVGELRLEARSPDNLAGTGRAFQRSFVYTLHKGRELLWTRRQPTGEDSPRRLYLDSKGFAVVLTHGLFFDRLLAFSPEGDPVAGVAVTADGTPVSLEVPYVVVDNAALTTAGLVWLKGTFPSFFTFSEARYFTLSTSSRASIILNLKNGELIQEPEARLQSALEEAQRGSTARYLQQAAGAGERWSKWLPDLAGAVLLHSALEANNPALLRALLCLPDCWTWRARCHSLEEGWTVEDRRLSGLLQAALRLSGEQPMGIAPAFRFLNPNRIEAPLPPTIAPDSEGVRGSAREVLELYGSPHHLQSYSEKQTSGVYQWGEHWEYYLGTGREVEAVRLTWEPGKRGKVLRCCEVVTVDLLDRLSELCSPI